MKRRFSPLWWPAFAVASPVLIPLMALKNRDFQKDVKKASIANQKRIAGAQALDMPQLECLEITPLVEWRTNDGFAGEPGVSLLISTDRGNVLIDLGFGADSGVLAGNASKSGYNINNIDALVITHLHIDHIGGGPAIVGDKIHWPSELGDPGGKPCFLPENAEAQGFTPLTVEKPTLLPGGIASTGPLARRLFFMGWCEEQVIMARVKDKGLVVITGCGHPGLETILKMAQRLSKDPIHAVVGGLHYPLTESRLKKPGLEATMIFGTGKPPWKRINQKDLAQAVHALREVNPKRLLLSAHDTCDYALDYFKKNLQAEFEVLSAGQTYEF